MSKGSFSMASHSNLESFCLNPETLDVLLYIVNHFKLPVVLHSSVDNLSKYTVDSEFFWEGESERGEERRTDGGKDLSDEVKRCSDYVKETVLPLVARWRYNNTTMTGGGDWTDWLIKELGHLKYVDDL